jgi:hypothetical protein
MHQTGVSVPPFARRHRMTMFVEGSCWQRTTAVSESWLKKGHAVVAMCHHAADAGYDGEFIMTAYRYACEEYGTHARDGINVVTYRLYSSIPHFVIRGTNIPANPVAFLLFAEPYQYGGMEEAP